jgi:ribonuclease III
LTSIEEGSNLVDDLASNDALSRIARENGLAKYIVKNPSQKGDIPPNTPASTVEAIFGAVWLDSNKDIKMVEQVGEAFHLIK